MATTEAPKPQAASSQTPSPSHAASNTDDPAASTSQPPSSATANTQKDVSSKPSSVTKTSHSPAARKPKSNKFWASLLAVLIPCATPKSAGRAHDIDVDPSTANGATKAEKKSAATSGEAAAPASGKEIQEKDKPSSKEASTSSPAAAPPSSTDAATSPSTPTKSKNVPAALTVPHITTTTPVDQNGDVTLVVPPSPNSHLLPREETEGVTSGAVQPPGSTGDATFTTDEEREGAEGEQHSGIAVPEMDVEDEDDEEERLILQGGTGIPIGPDGQPCPLLPPVSAAHKGRKCLVLDLDETLLHSSFKLIPQADYVVPVEIEWQWHNVYVIKRPGVDNFLKKMGEIYEVVIFTASLSKYADPVLDKLDVHKVVAHRLFRESCYNHKGNYVKDLSRLGRPIEDTIILDNSPASYIFHPNNAVPVSSWFNDPHDTELTDLCPFLADLMTVEDVRGVLDGGL